jgi:hypothetical protein
MKTKLMATAILLVAMAAFAVPADAQSGYRAQPRTWSDVDQIQADLLYNTVHKPQAQISEFLCDQWRGTGTAAEYSNCNGVRVDGSGNFEGFNPQSVAFNRFGGPVPLGMPVGNRYGYGRSPYGYGQGGYGQPYGYGGQYGSQYGYDGYYGSDVNIGGGTIGAVVGGVAGGTIMRHKGAGAQAAGVIGGAILGGLVGGKVDDHRKKSRWKEEGRREALAQQGQQAPQRQQRADGFPIVNSTGCNVRVGNTMLRPGESVIADPATAAVSVQSQSCNPVYRQGQGFIALVCQ